MLKFRFKKKPNRPEKRWPRPEGGAAMPHFIFLLTPPNSGSTAISSLLNTSHKTMLLQRRGEAQWLVPGLCEADRWDAAKVVDWDSVRSKWLSVYNDVCELAGPLPVVIEKSPPNMVRLEGLLKTFPKHSLLANNRDPYASCSSLLVRKFAAGGADSKTREKLLKELASEWVQRSSCISSHIQQRAIGLVTYEQFCADPVAALRQISLPDGVLESVNTDATLQVKDRPASRIQNFNETQIAELSSAEIGVVSEVLGPHQGLLELFGYKLR